MQPNPVSKRADGWLAPGMTAETWKSKIIKFFTCALLSRARAQDSRLNLRRGASTTSTSPVLGAESLSSCAGYSLAGVFPVPCVISAAGRLFEQIKAAEAKNHSHLADFRKGLARLWRKMKWD